MKNGRRDDPTLDDLLTHRTPVAAPPPTLAIVTLIFREDGFVQVNQAGAITPEVVRSALEQVARSLGTQRRVVVPG